MYKEYYKLVYLLMLLDQWININNKQLILLIKQFNVLKIKQIEIVNLELYVIKILLISNKEENTNG